MANRVKSVLPSAQELRCPICLDVYTVPMSLPCLHTYCQHCLHKYIVKNVAKGKKGATFNCPECRKKTFPPLPDIPVDKWAEHYPYNTVLLSVLPPDKRKVDKSCDSCLYEGNFVRATCFCTVCKESLCPACEKVHKKNKALRDHTVVNIQDLYTDPELAVNLSVSVTCPEHVGKEFEFYYKSHGSMCCSECFYKSHRVCMEVLQVKDYSERLRKEKEANTVVDRLKQIRSHLDQFKNENERSFETIKAEVKSMSDEIEQFRTKLNTLLDNVKAKITMETNALLKEESLVRHEANQQCECISSTVGNSLYLLETVLAHGSPLHVLTTLHKIGEQLVHYESTVKEKYCEVRHVDSKLCIDDRLLSLIKCKVIVRKTGVRHDAPEAEKKIGEEHKNKQKSLGSKPLKDCKPEQVGQFNADSPDCKDHYFIDIKCLPDDKIMLVDSLNSTCRLYGSSYQHLADYKTTSPPRGVCVVGGFQVAVTLPDENKIQFLTVDNSIQPGRIIQTSLSCGQIAVLSRDHLVVNGMREGILCWCIVSIDGSEKASVEVCSTGYFSHLSVNKSRTHIYVSSYRKSAAVYAYSLDETLIFKYEHQTLDGASGVATDREDNLYVAGQQSHNIHQVSPGGDPLQVFSTGIQHPPYVLCFTQRGDEFLSVESRSTVVKKYKLK